MTGLFFVALAYSCTVSTLRRTANLNYRDISKRLSKVNFYYTFEIQKYKFFKVFFCIKHNEIGEHDVYTERNGMLEWDPSTKYGLGHTGTYLSISPFFHQ